MRQLFIGLLSLTGTGLLAQTKEVAFESHSGNRENFKIALSTAPRVENDLFDSEESNFGLPPNKKTYQLDSVIYISDSMAVVVTKEFSQPFNSPKDSARFVGARKDTVFNDPLYTRKHSLDSIRNAIQTLGKYVNPVNKVVFVGYDNKKKKEKQQGITPVSFINDNGNSNSNNSPFDTKLMLMLGTVLLLSLLGGWLTWRFYRPVLQ